MSKQYIIMFNIPNGFESLSDAAEKAVAAIGEEGRPAFIYELVETISVERKIKRESHRPPSGIQLQETS